MFRFRAIMTATATVIIKGTETCLKGTEIKGTETCLKGTEIQGTEACVAREQRFKEQGPVSQGNRDSRNRDVCRRSPDCLVRSSEAFNPSTSSLFDRPMTRLVNIRCSPLAAWPHGGGRAVVEGGRERGGGVGGRNLEADSRFFGCSGVGCRLLLDTCVCVCVCAVVVIAAVAVVVIHCVAYATAATATTTTYVLYLHHSH